MFGGPCDGQTLDIDDCASSVIFHVLQETKVFSPDSYVPLSLPMKTVTYTRDTSRVAAFVFSS